jgi:prepilin peptidase CpaA
MLEVLALALFAGLLIYAACCDIASLTIPNWASIALAAIFPAAALAHGLALTEIGLHLLFGVAVLAVGFFLFAANIIGGGDAKLLAATAVWAGFPAFPTFILSTAIAGGVLALALLAARALLKQAETQPPFVNRLLKPRGGVPYGVAIMAGGLMSIPALPLGFASLTMP